MKRYQDYSWKKGVPIGISPISSKDPDHYYLILSEPYHRYYVVEEYQNGEFLSFAYDSQLFDFRLLQPASQVGWRKTSIGEDTYLIRNLEERVILREEYHYRDNLCVICEAYSPHGPLISTQKILYTRFGDPINGVILHDRKGKIVTYKRYALDDEGHFSEVLEEEWDLCSSKKIL